MGEVRQGLQFVQIAGGGFAVQNDASSGPEYATFPVMLGQTVDYIDSKLRLLRFRYVQYNPTAHVTPVVGPVFFKDNTETVVTPTLSESVTATPNDVAGALLNINVSDGNGCWIQVYGYLGAASDAFAAASSLLAPSGGVTKGDLLVSAAGQQIITDVAAGTAPSYIPWAEVLTTQATTGHAFDARIIL